MLESLCYVFYRLGLHKNYRSPFPSDSKSWSSSSWGDWLFLEVTKVTLASSKDHKQHISFTANDFLVYQILFAVDIGSEPGVLSLAACVPVSIMPFPRRVSYDAFLPSVPLF